MHFFKMKISRLFLVLLSLCVAAGVRAETTVDYRASLMVNASSGDFAPYMIGSWNYGRVTGANGIWQNGEAVKAFDLGKRFSWGAGLEYMLGYGSSTDYRRWDSGSKAWGTHSNRQSSFRFQQFYAELKYRAVFLTLGMKNNHSNIVDDRLSSGDLVRSNNARPVPGIAAGFLDFQNIPFTNGWVQIDGEIMYGKFTDNGYTKNTYNYYNDLIPLGLWYTYKYCRFRTKPTEPFVVTVGMQTAGEFGGTTTYYKRGEQTDHINRGFHVKDVFEMFFPMEGSGEGYYKGNSLGSWDLKIEYRFRNDSHLKAYFQGPFEDGSGIGRQNGWDGLWGLQYDFAKKGAVSSILFEYIDFTNQSGPIHFATSDNNGTTITTEVTGGDNYYNNDVYGPYANYGMGIGSAFPLAPLYNADGQLMFLHNRCRGFHAAVLGQLPMRLEYRAMLSYQKAGGWGRKPGLHRLESTSAMLEAAWQPSANIPALHLKAQVAFDAGKLRGNNFGAMATVSWTGSLTFDK